MLQTEGYNITLDRKEKGADIDFVSHAHSDHIASVRTSNNILASKETTDLLKVLSSIDQKKATDSFRGTHMLDAGHILGSKQIVVNDERLGEKVIYTGDFQMQKSRTCKNIQVESADTIIVDSTYPHPKIEFDERGETETAMQMWTEKKLMNGIVLFGAYSLGKAQEIISILNEVNIVPIVSKKISQINKVYTENGVRLDYASEYDENSHYEELRMGNFVGVVEHNLLNKTAMQMRQSGNRQIFTAVATGFAKVFRFGTDAQFPLSDHADFRQAMDYIGQTGAKNVFTYGSNSEILAQNLRNHGQLAHPLVKGDVLLAYNIA